DEWLMAANTNRAKCCRSEASDRRARNNVLGGPRMGSCRLFGGVAAAALLLVPGTALAQEASAALEARIAQLEAELNSLKSEVAAARTQQTSQAQDIVRLEARPAPVPALAPPLAPTPVSDAPREEG